MISTDLTHDQRANRRIGNAQRITQSKRTVSEDVERISPVGAVDVEVKKDIGCYLRDNMQSDCLSICKTDLK
jgi:hypothetical protein